MQYQQPTVDSLRQLENQQDNQQLTRSFVKQPIDNEDIAFKLIQYDAYNDIDTNSKESIFAPYQLAVKLAIHPLSDKYRFLVNHSTGSGKTLTSLLVARNFTNFNSKVFIITFNPSQFIKELSSVPELGYVSKQELKIISEQQDQQKVLERQIQKRINKRIIFMGYKELFLNLFKSDQNVNTELISRFKNSLVICDEVHNIYNNKEKNIYGISIQFLSYILGKDIFLLYLSATPLSYYKELGSLLNIMQVQEKSSENINQFIQQLKSQNLFTEQSISDKKILTNRLYIFEQMLNQLQTSIQVTNENAESLIQSIMKNRISFVPEIRKDFPVSTSKGIQYKSIPNIIIQTCELSKEFKQNMMALPNYMKGDESVKNIILHPQYDINQLIMLGLRENPEVLKWLKENKINIIQGQFQQSHVLSGDFLKLNNINKYSPKLYFVLNELLHTKSKSFIYINGLQDFGVDLVVEMLKQNGIILYDNNPNNNSICFQCKQMLRSHTVDHEFIPYRMGFLSGSNIIEGESYLRKFNSLSNQQQPRYHVLIGNIKMKEGYNVFAVNNSYILTLPYNITNLIQVLGRCSRNKSHEALPPNQQYINNYLLINSSKDSHLFGNKEFLDLQNKQKDSNFYGQITRDEFVLWEKSQDFQKVQLYEQMLHRQSLDIKYFYPLYFEYSIDQKDDIINIKSNNQLKMLPFSIQKENLGTLTQDSIQNQDFKLDTFFVQNIAQLINKAVLDILNKLIQKQHIWDLDTLVDTVMNYPQAPNLQIIPKELVKQKIFSSPNIYVVDNFVICSQVQPEMNFFLQGIVKSPLVTIEISKKQERNQQIQWEYVLILFDHIGKICPQYIDFITNKKVPTSFDFKQLSLNQAGDIFKKLMQIFAHTSTQTIISQYKSSIIKYNQQKNAINAIKFISVVNLLFPFTYDIQNVSQLSKSSNSIYISGFIQDLNTQIHISINGEMNKITPKRDILFPELVYCYMVPNKQFKFIQLQINNRGLVKQDGFKCQNYDKNKLIQMDGKKHLSKEDHCSLIMNQVLSEHFSGIFQFKPFYQMIFNFDLHW